MASTRSTSTSKRASSRAAAKAGAEAANTEPTVDKVDDKASGVATEADNKKLKHTRGGSTTRDDALDLGVPMLPGDGSEPVGPEDALGKGPKRGDYRNKLGGDGYHPHEGNVPQRPRAENRGDVKGKKGGVTTTEDDK